MVDRTVPLSAITLASIASHLADSLYRFVDELPEAAREVRSVISTLFEIKTLLRELDSRFADPRFGRLSRELQDDIGLGMGSCSSSLKDLDGIVLRCSMTRRGSSPRGARKSWSEILSSFRNIEGSSLQARLDVHKTFLYNLAGLLRSMFAPSRTKKNEQRAEVHHFQEQIRLLAIQQQKVAARMREAEEHHRRTVEEQAYQARYQAPTMTPMLPVSQPYDSPPRRPYSTPLPSPPFQPPVDTYRYLPTAIHERPMTPVSPISPISPLGAPVTPPMVPRRYSVTPAPALGSRGQMTPPQTPPISRPKSRVANPQIPSKVTSDHWWSQVFGMCPGSTSLSEPPNQSECYGAQMENLSMAPEEHEIFRVKFDNGLMLRMFRNDASEEAKVVCTKGGDGASWSSGRRNGYTFQTAVNASKLDISRDGPGVKLMRRNLVWAILYFADFETLTLFYHAFLALRFNAPSAPVPKETEYWLDGESLVFSAKIDDDGYTHALRLLKDNESGCIRLAAAKAEGEHDVTVWTAFITQQICQTGWLQYIRPRTVRMRNIRQFSFSSCFDTERCSDFELRFLQSADAHDFTQAIKALASVENANRAAIRGGYSTACNTPGAHMVSRDGYF